MRGSLTKITCIIIESTLTLLEAVVGTSACATLGERLGGADTLEASSDAPSLATGDTAPAVAALRCEAAVL